MERTDIIKYIFNFFKNNMDEEPSNYILSIIDNQSIEYTINNNGIFINLNVINNNTLYLIHDYIISLHGNKKTGIYTINNTPTKLVTPSDNFTPTPDTIKYDEYDIRLLSLSTNVLTI